MALAVRDERIEKLEAEVAALKAAPVELLAQIDAETEEKLQVAQRVLEDALAASGDENYRTVLDLLNLADAGSAASALTLVSSWGENRELMRALRDVVTTRCISRARPGDRVAFLSAAGVAFDRDFTETSPLKSALLLSFHKWMFGKPGVDMSTNARHTLRRGSRRAPRNRSGDGGGKVGPPHEEVPVPDQWAPFYYDSTSSDDDAEGPLVRGVGEIYGGPCHGTDDAPEILE